MMPCPTRCAVGSLMKAMRFQYRLRERARRVELMAGAGGVAAEHVDLTDVRRDVMGVVELRRALVARADAAAAARRHRQPFQPFEVAVGNRHVEARVVVRRRTEDVERLRHAEAPGVVRRAGHILEAAAVRLEAVHPLAELHLLPVHLAVEARVADRAPDVVVGSVHQARRPGMRVANAPSGAEDLPDVGLVVAVGVLQEQHVRRRRDDHAAVGEDQARRQVQVVGEHGELVGTPVTVGVLDDLDAVVSGVAVEHHVRVVDRFDDPQPAALVEVERDRFDDVRLLREQLQLELGRHLDELHRVVRRERQLVLRHRIAVLVVRDDEGVDVGDVGHLHLDVGAARRLVDGPDDRLLDQLLEVRVAPRRRLVAVSGVEHPALALRSHPGERFPALPESPLHEDGRLRAGGRGGRGAFIGRRKGLDVFHNRMRRLDDLGGHRSGERLRGSRLRPDLADQRRAVNREHSLAVVHERRERLLLVRGEGLVAEDHQRVVVRQPAGSKDLGRRRDVNQLDAAPGQCRRERPEDRRRGMRCLLEPEEEHAQRPCLRFTRGRPRRGDSRRRGAWRRRRLRLRLGKDREGGGAEETGEDVHRPDLRAGTTECHGRRTFQVAGPLLGGGNMEPFRRAVLLRRWGVKDFQRPTPNSQDSNIPRSNDSPVRKLQTTARRARSPASES